MQLGALYLPLGLLTEKNKCFTLKSYNDLNSFKGFKIMSINIRSLVPKFNQFLLELGECELDIICINESWLKNETDSGHVSIDNFSLTRLDRSVKLPNGDVKKGGGVCTYVRKNFNTTQIDKISFCSPDLELLGIEVTLLSSMRTVLPLVSVITQLCFCKTSLNKL